MFLYETAETNNSDLINAEKLVRGAGRSSIKAKFIDLKSDDYQQRRSGHGEIIKKKLKETD